MRALGIAASAASVAHAHSPCRLHTSFGVSVVSDTNENNSTPQRSEQREVAQFAVDYMIRSFLASNSGLVGDSVSLMSRCWVWPRMPIDIPDIDFVRDTLYPFYDLALPPQPSGATKQRKTAPDPLSILQGPGKSTHNCASCGKPLHGAAVVPPIALL